MSYRDDTGCFADAVLLRPWPPLNLNPHVVASWRRTNLGHLLFSATGLCIAQKRETVRRAGFTDVTDADLTLFQNLDPLGTRLTVLAARADSTKQSMIELVDKAERRGLIERHADSIDSRAKVVRLTVQGASLSELVRQGMAEAEAVFSTAVGPDRLPAIHRALIAYAPGRAEPSSLEQMLARAARRFLRGVLAAVHEHGYREITVALLALFRMLELEGSRLTELAQAARITKQSMRILVARAESLGLVERAGDPCDRRARIIRFSAAGLTMLDDMHHGVLAAEAEFAEMTGGNFLHDLKDALLDYLSRFRPTESLS